MSALPRPAALLFDLDGTIVDSRRDIAEALNRALSSAGIAPLALEEVLPFVGDGARKLVERAMRFRGREPDDAVIAAFHRDYLEHPCVHTTLLDGAKELLALGIPCALVTNKPRAITVLVLEALGIFASFKMVWAGGDGPLKPAPDGVLAAASHLGVPVQNAWMIGDGPQDVLAAKAAGAYAVGVEGIGDEAALLAAQPDRVVRSLRLLLDLF